MRNKWVGVLGIVCLLAACTGEQGVVDVDADVVDAAQADHFCTTHNAFDELCGECGLPGQFCCYDFNSPDWDAGHPPSYCFGEATCISDICFGDGTKP